MKRRKRKKKMNKKNAPPVLREGYFYCRSWKKSIQHERMDDAALSAFFRYRLFYTAWGAVIFASSQPFLIPIWAMLSLCLHSETLRGMNHVPFLQKFFTCRRFHVKLFTVYKERGRIRWLLQREGRLCFPRLLVNEGCKCHFM